MSPGLPRHSLLATEPGNEDDALSVIDVLQSRQFFDELARIERKLVGSAGIGPALLGFRERVLDAGKRVAAGLRRVGVRAIRVDASTSVATQ